MALYIFEVALRNVTDHGLTAKRGAGWMDDDKTLTIKYQSNCVTKAREQLTRDGKPATTAKWWPNRISTLGFSFWRRSHHLWQICGRFFRRAAFKQQHRFGLDDFRPCGIGSHTTDPSWRHSGRRYADINHLDGWLSPSAAAWINETLEWPPSFPACLSGYGCGNEATRVRPRARIFASLKRCTGMRAEPSAQVVYRASHLRRAFAVPRGRRDHAEMARSARWHRLPQWRGAEIGAVEIVGRAGYTTIRASALRPVRRRPSAGMRQEN